MGAFEGGESTNIVYCDLSKAFDCVSHEILLKKLPCYGVKSDAIELLKSYLTDRSQKTYFLTFSGHKKIEHGVPQGSLLAPLLFLIYINDIKAAVPNSTLSLFADDTALINTDENFEELNRKTNESLQALERWFNSNQLLLNAEKTVNITFSLKKLVVNQDIQEVKFLGVYLDPTLTFQNHIEHLAKRLSKTLYLLRRLKELIPFTLLLQTFHGLFQSVACYAILAWGHSCHMDRIFKQQRRALRIICGMAFREDVKEKFTELKILTIPSRFVFESLIYAYQNQASFQTNTNFHNYNTRSANNIRPDFIRLQKSRISSNHYCIEYFNKLPTHTKKLPLQKFKKYIKDMLIEKALYSIHCFEL